MYTTSTTVSSRIESYCRTWRMWLENDESVIMGDNIMSATSDVQSTSLSDDIELGAVCSQSWALQINDAETRFLGKEYDLSLYLADLTGVTTYSTLEAYTYAELSKLTVEQISKLGEVLDGERIPLGRFTCVKSKSRAEILRSLLRIGFTSPTRPMCQRSSYLRGQRLSRTTYASSLDCKTATTTPSLQSSV